MSFLVKKPFLYPAIGVFLAAGFFVFLGGAAQAIATLNVIPSALTINTDAVAEWSTAQAHSGSNSVHLQTTGTIGSGREARIRVAMPSGTTLSDITSISWWEYLAAGYPPHVDIKIDKDGDGTEDDALVFEYAYNRESHYAEAPMPYDALLGAWYQTFSDDSNGPTAIDDTANAWLSSGDPGPLDASNPPFIYGTLANWKAGTVNTSVSGATVVTALEIEVDNWVLQSEAYVDDVTVTVSGAEYYVSIQEAIDAATSGDTINVAAGTYDEQLVINKDVTISDQTGAIIQPTGNDDAWDIQFVDGGSGATLEGFTLDFNGATNNRLGRGIGVSDFNGPIVTGVTIQDNDITMGVGTGAATIGLEGVGIQTGKNADVSGLQILNNDFHGGSAAITDGSTKGEEGIYINPNSGVGSITISGNTFDGQLFTGISVEAGNVTVSENTITRPSIVQNTQGIRVNDFVGGITYAVTASGNTVSGFANGIRVGSGSEGGSTLTVTLSDNTISGNTRGIWVRNDAVVTANNKNSITGNTSFGAEILAGSDGTLNAANNWWGDATGPTHANNPGGLGDSVSNNVDFDPWYTDAAKTTLSGGATIGSVVPADVDAFVDENFTPEIGSNIPRASTAYLGRTTTYLGSPLGADGDTIKWKVTIHGPSALTAGMVDLDEVGWEDQSGSSIEAFHYQFTAVDGDLVALGSCDLPIPNGHGDPETCTTDVGFSLDANDVFTNADKIGFGLGAPNGNYTITYNLVDTKGTAETADDSIVGTHTVNVEVVSASILSANPSEVNASFVPQIGSTIIRDTSAYLGRTTNYTGSVLGADTDSIKWRVTISGPADLTADMVDLDEVGFNDPDGDPINSIGTYHYPFQVQTDINPEATDDLVATGSCDDADTHANDCATLVGFSLDANDIFTNADTIKFNPSAPTGFYSITYELVDTAADAVVGTFIRMVTVAVLSDAQMAPDADGSATVTNTFPQIVLTSPTQAVDVTIDSGTTNPTIDVSAFITGGTGTLPEITITSANANNANVAIPASTVVTSADITWNGVIAAPTVTTVSLPEASGQTKTLSTAIEVGFTGAKLSFDKAVRLLLPGQAGKRAGYVRTGITFTEITNICAADDQATGDALAADGDCKIDVGSDLAIWTKHFTSFATYTQAATPVSSGGGGGGGGGIVGGGGGGFTAPTLPSQTGTVAASTASPASQPTAGQPAGTVLGATAFRFAKSLQVGSRGDDVTELQKRLTEEGTYSGPITGYFGPLTLAGVKAYQEKNGIETVGIVGPKTRASLNSTLAQAAVPQTGQVLGATSYTPLAEVQIQSILNLLVAFEVDQATIDNVNNALRGLNR